MAAKVLNNHTVLALKPAIRDREISKKQLRSTAQALGGAMSSAIAKLIDKVSTGPYFTPMGMQIFDERLGLPLTAVISTKSDFDLFGQGIATAVGAVAVGHMDFGTDRGIAALDATHRAIHLPNIVGHWAMSLLGKLCWLLAVQRSRLPSVLSIRTERETAS
jgi:hypothetical protein